MDNTGRIINARRNVVLAQIIGAEIKKRVQLLGRHVFQFGQPGFSILGFGVVFCGLFKHVKAAVFARVVAHPGYIGPVAPIAGRRVV